MRKTFDEVFEDVTKFGTKVKTDEYHADGVHVIIDQGQEQIAGYTDSEEGLFTSVPALIFGDHTRVVKYVDMPFFLGADGVKVLRSKFADANYRYLYYALKSIRVPNTGYNRHFKWLKEAEIEYPNNNEQRSIVSILDRLSDIIDARKAELQKLDELVKARFVEMFGDPIHKSSNLMVLPMTEVCEIIDGDRGKNYPKQDEFFNEEYCLFLNAKNVTNHGFDFSECMFITEEKDKALRKGKLQRGDVVLTTRGTLGNLAFYTDEISYDNIRINSGMVILRMNKAIIDEGFFIEQFKMQVDDIKKSIASGSAQPQLPISTMNKIGILVPDLSLQKEFSNFVAQVDKSKAAVQQALDKVQLLFDSLLQQFFG